MNLLVNAAQAIDHQGEIDIATRQEDGSIGIEIADSGCGIPPDKPGGVPCVFYSLRQVCRSKRR
jgi:C4-dicarboxylate-specific signal transduction histidine kinase